MKPEEYLTYFEDFIFIADNLSAEALAKAEESGQKNPFAEVSIRPNGLEVRIRVQIRHRAGESGPDFQINGRPGPSRVFFQNARAKRLPDIPVAGGFAHIQTAHDFPYGRFDGFSDKPRCQVGVIPL